jgi:hypothetical protein
MRISVRHRDEKMELLEGLNEEGLTSSEAILLRMCRV